MTGSGRRPARSRIKSSINAIEYDDTIRNTKPSSNSHHRLRKIRNHDHSLIRIFNVNLKLLLGFGVFAFSIGLFLVHHLMKPFVEDAQKPRVVTPFPAPKLMDLPQFHGEHKESLYWGTYRPQVYLGIRARTPRSLLAGLMWIGLKEERLFMRHVCQDSDDLGTYGWTHHNGRDYGHQVIVDQDLTLATSFLKSKGVGSSYGGDWAVRIDVQSEKWNEQMRSGHLFVYLTDEDDNAPSLNKDTLKISKNSLLASGSRMDVGIWQLHLKSMDDLEVYYSGFRTPHIHNLSDLVQENLGGQISGRVPFKTDIAFVSGTGLENSKVEERLNSLTA